MSSNQQPEVVGELLDRIPDGIESLLTYGMVAQTIDGYPAAQQCSHPPGHRTAAGESAIASASSR